MAAATKAKIRNLLSGGTPSTAFSRFFGCLDASPQSKPGMRTPHAEAGSFRLSERRQRGSRIAPGVGAEHLEIVAAEERSRVLDVDHTHAAAHLLHGDVLVLCHPGFHARQHHADVLDAVL